MTKAVTHHSCRECGSPFTGQWRATCSPECLRERRRKQYQQFDQKRRPLLVRTITCRQCSDEFEFIGPGARAFCDDHVRYETRRGKRRYNAGTSWRYSLKYKFGLTLEQWDALLIAQSGRCAICGCTPKADASFAVDHDHACCPGDRKTCGKCVRGLLCMKCNVAIGHMSDDPTRLRAAASYLETHSNAPSGAGEVHT